MDNSSMEVVLCSGHNTPCFLKTGTKPGPRYERNFYMCSSLANSCGFVKESIKSKAKHCPVHGELIGIQRWSIKNTQEVYFFCAKREGGYCGTYTASTKEEERKENVPFLLKNQRSEKGVEKDTGPVPALSKAGAVNDVESSSVQVGVVVGHENVIDLTTSGESQPITSPIDHDTSSSLHDTNSTVNDTSSSVCDTSSSLHDTNSSLHDTNSTVNDTSSSVCDTSSSLRDANSSIHDTNSSVNDTSSSVCDTNSSLRNINSTVNDTNSSVCDTNSSIHDNSSGACNTNSTVHDIDSSIHNINNISSSVCDTNSSFHDNSSSICDTNSSIHDNTSSVCDTNSSIHDNSSGACDTNSTVHDIDSSIHNIGSSVSDDDLRYSPINNSNVNFTDSDDQMSVASGQSGVSVASGQSGVSVASGQSGVSVASGQSGVSVASGQSGVSVASGQSGVSVASGQSGVSVTSCQSGVSVASGQSGKHSASRPNVITVDEDDEKQFQVGYQRKKVLRQYFEIQTQSAHLPDGGAALRMQQKQVTQRLRELKVSPPKVLDPEETASILISQRNITAQSKLLTVGAVKHLHSSLATCPTEDTQTENPPGLTVSLMAHQKRALAWLMWRETQTPAAGILADDMGLGKTLSMLSLVVKNSMGSEEAREWKKQPPAMSGLVKSVATLVVCPASLLMQWQAEASSKFEPGSLSVLIYHGSNRTTYPQDLTNYDLVITTYNIVGTEEASCESEEPIQDTTRTKRKTGSHSTLFKVHWRRVVLDEAHNIKNPKTAMSIGCCRLQADYRWAVTGTPVQNSLKDFYSLVKFIHLAPFDDYRVWRDTVEQKGTRGMERLNTMVASLVLRRTKEELGDDTLKLTKRIETRHSITLKAQEMEIYTHIYNEARKVMYKWLQDQGENVGGVDATSWPGGQDEPDLPNHVAPIISRIMRGANTTTGKGSCVLWMLLRLRQCCCHLQLLMNQVEGSDAERRDDIDIDLRMGTLSLNDAEGSRPVDSSAVPAIFTRERQSTKVAQVIIEIRRILQVAHDPPLKCVPPRERLNRVKSLNSPSRVPSVMLLSLQAGGVGLNLIGANHVFLLDMHWNPALEQQAADRCHRMGQTRDVYIHKFVCEGTVEERILRLQEKKLQLASNVLAGASEKSRSNKLTLSDLKDLFELH